MNKIKSLSLFTSLSLIFAFTLLMNVNCVVAEELEDIAPNMGFEFVVVLQGLSTGSINTTTAAPFDITSVGIVSIGNNRLTASLNMPSEQSGIWWMSIVGTGGKTDADFVFGLTPFVGQNAQIEIDPGVSFAIAIGGVISLTPVTEEDPLKYSIIVTGG